MTSASEAERTIFLLPLEDTESVPLRRWLGREAWRTDPVVSLGYEPNGDRVLFRLVNIPSTASGVVDAVDPPILDGELFIGFDGTDTRAWPTTIAMLDFRRQCHQDGKRLQIVRELVGSSVWTAALALREMAASEHEIRLSSDEATWLIRRWADLVIGPISEAADAALAEWTAKADERTHGGRPEVEPAPSRSMAALGQSSIAAAYVTASAGSAALMPRAEDSGRHPFEGGLDAGRQSDESTATGAGAAMARRSTTTRDDQSGPIHYGILARISDIWAARRDGNNGVPPLPEHAVRADRAKTDHGVTPYMEIRNRHFLDWAERERRRMLGEQVMTYQTRAEVRQKIVGADEKAAAAREVLDGMPSGPDDPDRRNVLEQHAHESLVRARRHREYQAQRTKMLTLQQQAIAEANQLRAQEARLTESIAAREKELDAQVRQLLQHSLRRCGTYMRHIVHHHPDGTAVIPYLKLALPDVPVWLQNSPADDTSANGHAIETNTNGQVVEIHANGQSVPLNGSESA
ncbi:MAG TPA: hypothetical protein VGM14_18220 [Streptosporangiaceae bacterium]